MYGLYPCWDIKGCCNLDYERLCLLAILWILWNVRCLFDKIRLQPYRDYTHRHCSHSPIWCTYKLRGSSNIGFQDSLDCCMDSSSRCIKQVCKLPSGHPYFTIGNMDALFVVCYDSSFHSYNLLEWYFIGCFSLLGIDQIGIYLSCGHVLMR